MKYKIKYQEKNKIKSITIEAKDYNELINSKLYPNNIISIKEPLDIRNLLTPINNINKKDIYELFNQLNLMLSSNITISEAISLLLQTKQKKEIEEVLLLLQNSINNSIPIDIALRRYKKVIGETSILFLKLGIENGNIKESINSLVKLNEQNTITKSKLKDILNYPIILISSLFIAIGMIFIYVIPNFQYVFEILGDNLPLSTKILLWLQDIVQNYYMFFILLPFIIYFSLLFLYKKYKLFFDRMILSNIPILSALIKSYNLYKLFLAISIIVKSKYQFQIAIENSKNIIENNYIKLNMKKIIGDIRSGSSIADAFKNTKIFDDLTIKLLYTAQYTNNYENILNDISNLHKQNFENSIKKFSSFIEPAIILLISMIVLWLVLAVMVPMWDMSSAIN